MVEKQKKAEVKKEEIIRLQIMKEKIGSQAAAQSFNKVIEIKSRQIDVFFFPKTPFFQIPPMELFVDGDIPFGVIEVEQK